MVASTMVDLCGSGYTTCYQFSSQQHAVAMKVTKKYRVAKLRKQQKKEYRNLKKALPSLSRVDKVTKLTVIEEAIRYIDFLHSEITNKVLSYDEPISPIKDNPHIMDTSFSALSEDEHFFESSSSVDKQRSPLSEIRIRL